MAQQGLSTLAYRVRGHVIATYLGKLCGVIALLLLAPAAVAFGYGEHAAGLRYLAMAAALCVPALLARHLRAPTSLQINEALVITAVAFVIGAACEVYPFMGTGLSALDALFEAVSGITTTGLSTLAGVQEQPRSFLFARAWLQWHGGLGIVVFSLGLLMGPGVVARRLAAAGGDVNDIPGTSRAYARRVIAVYLVLTVTGVAATIALGQDPFNALVQILAAVSTGGFSSFDISLAALDGWGARAAVLSTCLSGAVPLALYYQAWRNGWRQILTDREVQALLLAVALVTVALWLVLLSSGRLAGFEALRQSAAMAISAQTTSGFSTIDAAGLDAPAKAVLILSMTLGGGMGSTAGGIKVVRLLILLRLAHLLILRTALPSHAVAEPRLNGARLQPAEVQRALVIILLYALVILLSWLPFLAYGYDPLDALFEVVSATATVGLSAGVTSAALEPLLKAVLCLDMLLGRLEILAVLVLVYPATWFGRKKEES